MDLLPAENRSLEGKTMSLPLGYHSNLGLSTKQELSHHLILPFTYKMRGLAFEDLLAEYIIPEVTIC